MEQTLSRRGAGVNLLASALILGLVVVAVVVFSEQVVAFLFHNPYLNSLIIGVFIIGVAYAMFWLTRIQREFNMLEDVRARWNLEGDRKRLNAEALRTLPPSEIRERLMFYTAQVSRSCPPDSGSHSEKVAMTLGLHVTITRYVAGLLVFLGLLGTFIGLLQTIGGVERVISALPTDAGKDVQVFMGEMRTGLGVPLKGMATAFSTSVFGLFTSLIVGFLHLQLASAQTRYISRLEALDSALFFPVFLEMGRMAGVVHATEPRESAPAQTETASFPVEAAPGTFPESIARYLEATQRQLKENLDRLMLIVERTESMQANYREVLLALGQEIETVNVAISRLSTNQDLMREGMSSLVDLARSENEGQRLFLAELKGVNETLARSIAMQQTLQTVNQDHHDDLMQLFRSEIGTLDKLADRE